MKETLGKIIHKVDQRYGLEQEKFAYHKQKTQIQAANLIGRPKATIIVPSPPYQVLLRSAVSWLTPFTMQSHA